MQCSTLTSTVHALTISSMLRISFTGDVILHHWVITSWRFQWMWHLWHVRDWSCSDAVSCQRRREFPSTVMWKCQHSLILWGHNFTKTHTHTQGRFPFLSYKFWHRVAWYTGTDVTGKHIQLLLRLPWSHKSSNWYVTKQYMTYVVCLAIGP
jgi:hypothetical protein